MQERKDVFIACGRDLIDRGVAFGILLRGYDGERCLAVQIRQKDGSKRTYVTDDSDVLVSYSWGIHNISKDKNLLQTGCFIAVN